MIAWQRTAALYIPILIAVCVYALRKPTQRQTVGAIFAGMWLTHSVVAVNLLAIQVGWWRFSAEGGVIAQLPVDVVLGWIILWAIVPTVGLQSQPLWRVLGMLLFVDLLLMPRLEPLLILHNGWWWGELLLLIIAYLPAHLLGRWTWHDSDLYKRVGLLVITFIVVVCVLLPSIILLVTGASWQTMQTIEEAGLFQRCVLVAIVLVVGVVGLSAVQVFAITGRGTPVPLDPPKQLVRSGVYAYMSNPMQMTIPIIYLLIALSLGHGWMLLAVVGAVMYGAGFAGLTEGEDMAVRFGDDWQAYKQALPAWRMRWRPIEQPHGTLYVGMNCVACSQVGAWFAKQRPTDLTLAPAPLHLTRLTYVAADGNRYMGVRALAYAFNHLHLGYAWLGWLIVLPFVGEIVQLINDVVGGDARHLPA